MIILAETPLKLIQDYRCKFFERQYFEQEAWRRFIVQNLLPVHELDAMEQLGAMEAIGIFGWENGFTLNYLAADKYFRIIPGYGDIPAVEQRFNALIQKLDEYYSSQDQRLPFELMHFTLALLLPIEELRTNLIEPTLAVNLLAYIGLEPPRTAEGFRHETLTVCMLAAERATNNPHPLHYEGLAGRQTWPRSYFRLYVSPNDFDQIIWG